MKYDQLKLKKKTVTESSVSFDREIKSLRISVG